MRRNGKPINPKVLFTCPLCGQLGGKWSVTSWPRGVWTCRHCFMGEALRRDPRGS